MARGAQEREVHGDVGVALCFYRKSIDMLHSAYVFSEMQSRSPSQDDWPIVHGFCAALEASAAGHPDAPFDETVREVTHRLRTISSACDRIGVNSDLYRSALDRIAASAPAVRVDEVLWT